MDKYIFELCLCLMIAGFVVEYFLGMFRAKVFFDKLIDDEIDKINKL